MCTSIVETAAVEGSGKGGKGWFSVTQAVVAYDHPRHAPLDDGIAIDFFNEAKGPEARAAVELTLESARALRDALDRAIAAADREEAERDESIRAHAAARAKAA